MSSFTSLLVVVACAALLQVGCEAQPRHNHRQWRQQTPYRRNHYDASIILGTVQGSDIRSLPILQISGGTDVIIGFPDNCKRSRQPLLGTAVVVTNNSGGPPPVLIADDPDDPQSNVVISCGPVGVVGKCSEGLSVTSYQYCGPALDRDPSNVTSEEKNVTSEELNVTSEELNVTSGELNVTAEELNVTSEKLNVTAEEINGTAEEPNVTAEQG